MKEYTFDTNVYNFRKLVEEFLTIEKLEEMHLVEKFEKQLTSAEGDYGDQKQRLHRMFYDKMDSPPSLFINLYRSFIKDIIQPLFSTEIYFQRFPTFRIHQPDNICVFKWHRDKEFGHNPKEINFFMPITKAYGNNTIWVENFVGAGSKNANPLEANYGEIIQWDGANLHHGNKQNNTGYTRVSFDFRVLRKKDFDESKVGVSLTKNVEFSPESYFSAIE